ncbi:short-chain dehydrogenase/reductase SDR [Planoprotostelium fungivorum]|uniref:3-oxoacyl-[acyl-carrier-protein] reductase n=1 Tax=Planoprotostelium fungivorum TaxID=1890364 RepID=A0A2P6NNY3_9EUKA|nr:short-chain dehydrogenase/reductase SDR [Planoprotostelium fungivorum]
MSYSIQGQVAIITGASSGVGRSIAVSLVKEGCKVVISGTNEKNLKETESACKTARPDANVHLVIANLKELDGTQKIIDETNRAFGAINILVNAAGVLASFDDSLEDWENTIQLNLIALMRATKLSLPHITKHPRGAIINIASVSGREAFKGQGPYTASKYGVVGFSKSIFQDVREKGVKVCSIEPGFINTPMVHDKEGLDFDKMIQPEDVAETVVFVLKFPETGCPTEILLQPQRTLETTSDADTTFAENASGDATTSTADTTSAVETTSTDDTTSAETTSAANTTSVADTTLTVDTTSAIDTTSAVETTSDDDTTSAAETTSAVDSAAETTSAIDSTSAGFNQQSPQELYQNHKKIEELRLHRMLGDPLRPKNRVSDVQPYHLSETRDQALQNTALITFLQLSNKAISAWLRE